MSSETHGSTSPEVLSFLRIAVRVQVRVWGRRHPRGRRVHGPLLQGPGPEPAVQGRWRGQRDAPRQGWERPLCSARSRLFKSFKGVSTLSKILTLYAA